MLSGMDKLGTQHADFLTVLESRLVDQKIRKSMVAGAWQRRGSGEAGPENC